MKIKKTLTTLALTGLLTATLAAPALAKDIVYPSATTGDSSVTATVDQTYTVTIPEKIDFEKLAKDTTATEKPLTVNVSNLLIDKNEVLKINVKGDDTTTTNAFTIRTTGGASIAYEVYNKSKSKVDPTGEFAAVASADTPDTVQDVSGNLKQTGAVIHSGSYAGTITFTCTVENKTT